MLWIYYPKTVQNLTQFNAPDPWNGSQTASFQLDRCFSTAVLPFAYEQEARPHRYAIRSGIDNQYRVLPDSLTVLWKDGKIPADRLPALLRGIEPELSRSDYIRILSMTPMQRVIRSYAPPVFGVILVLLGAIVMSDDAVMGGVMAALGVLLVVVSLVILRQWKGRRQQQMALALAKSAGQA